MSFLNSDQNQTAKLWAGSRSALARKTVWSDQCEVNVYWTGGNVTDLQTAYCCEQHALGKQVLGPTTSVF